MMEKFYRTKDKPAMQNDAEKLRVECRSIAAFKGPV